ncbi:MAG: hypothetical protein AAGF12_33135, partial [Myxococcota bacterium]
MSRALATQAYQDALRGRFDGLPSFYQSAPSSILAAWVEGAVGAFRSSAPRVPPRVGAESAEDIDVLAQTLNHSLLHQYAAFDLPHLQQIQGMVAALPPHPESSLSDAVLALSRGIATLQDGREFPDPGMSSDP